ncbi:hypothetical protein TrVE_jg12421 [Triparma verrucosa]|uniref:PUB domain-containing protein n=1 Tax=Triparma verrucosa TaxID=1606542 RepID=A0A9W7F6J8_9STRA|nr:hypothetical protein TrVE_jg12421 [Triparma verrucosa]
MSTNLSNAASFYNWINNRNAQPPAHNQDNNQDDDGMSDDDMNDDPPPPPQYLRRPPAPSPTSYGLLLVHSGSSSDLSTLSLLQHSVTPFVTEYPHVKFAHISSEVPGFEKGTSSHQFEVTATPTFIVFNFSTKKQKTRLVSADPQRLHLLPDQVRQLLESEVPKRMVFKETLGTGGTTTSGGGVDPREARLARFAAAANNNNNNDDDNASSTPPPPAQPMETSSPSSNVGPSSSSSVPFNRHTSIFKSDPNIMDNYDVKYGLKSASQVLEEKRLLAVAERKADVLRHKKEKKESLLERERLRLQISQDKIERKQKKGYLNSRLGPEGYAPDALLKNTDGWTSSPSKSPPKTPTRTPSEIIVDSVQKLSLYKSCGSGGLSMSLLILFINNVIEKPNEEKYRRINTNSKSYVEKLKGKIGAAAILKACGWRKEEGEEGRLVLGEVEGGVLREAKRELESGRHRFEKEQERVREEAIRRMKEREVRP